MTFCLILMGMQISWASIAKLEPVVTLAPLPEESDYFLQAPRQIAIDESGRFFVLDVESYSVFIWEKDGQFLGQFGKQGSGPGEFVFSGRRGGAQGFMGIHDETIFVFDPAKREILTFSTKDYAFKGAVPLQLARARPVYWEVLPNDQFLVYYRRFSEEGIMRKIGLFDKDGKEIKTLQSFKDETFSVKQGGSGRGSRQYSIAAFAPAPVVNYDPIRSQIIIGNSQGPRFSVYDKAGKKIKSIKFQLPHRPVIDEDKDEFKEQPFIKNSSRVKVEFPEYKAYYDQILTLKDQGYLVFNRSPYYRHMEGAVLDADGNIKARFKILCGENGDLVGNSGRLFGIITDDEGEFSLQELRVVVKSGKT